MKYYSIVRESEIQVRLDALVGITSANSLNFIIHFAGISIVYME